MHLSRSTLQQSISLSVTIRRLAIIAI